MKRVYGAGDDSLITPKKNAFLFPNDPNAEFPQAPAPEYVSKAEFDALSEKINDLLKKIDKPKSNYKPSKED